MTGRAWAIKLGSGGQCIPFCERHEIVGIGWRSVSPRVLAAGSREELSRHVREVCGWYETERDRGMAVGQLYRFARECQVGDYILYYDPPKKQVVFCRVASEPMFRDFELEDDVDIWHLRHVEYPIDPIPILDFYAVLKGRLLGPRMSFWQLRPFEIVDQLARGGDPKQVAAPDPEIEAAYVKLGDLLVRRAEALDAEDWEWLVVDYFKAQGAHVDERFVGGSRPLIDAEARFDHGELGDETWRIQVKRYQDQKVDWPAIEADLTRIGEARFCFVSVYGFTADARAKAAEQGIRLLEAGDFVRFLLSGRVRERIRMKLQLPLFTSAAVDPVEPTEPAPSVPEAVPSAPTPRRPRLRTFDQLLGAHVIDRLTEGTEVTSLAWRVAMASGLKGRISRTYERPSGEGFVVGFVVRGPVSVEDQARLLESLRERVAALTVALRSVEHIDLDLEGEHPSEFSAVEAVFADRE